MQAGSGPRDEKLENAARHGTPAFCEVNEEDGIQKYFYFGRVFSMLPTTSEEVVSLSTDALNGSRKVLCTKKYDKEKVILRTYVRDTPLDFLFSLCVELQLGDFRKTKYASFT